jgi:hypothetical protein
MMLLWTLQPMLVLIAFLVPDRHFLFVISKVEKASCLAHGSIVIPEGNRQEKYGVATQSKLRKV